MSGTSSAVNGAIAEISSLTDSGEEGEQQQQQQHAAAGGGMTSLQGDDDDGASDSAASSEDDGGVGCGGAPQTMTSGGVGGPSSLCSSLDETTCAICMDSTAGVAVTRCAHSLCMQCAYQLCSAAKGLPLCPFCRSPIDAFEATGL